MRVYTGGTFDLFHAGHVNFLRHCKKIAGDDGEVIVALNSDQFVLEYKGKLPIYRDWERMMILKNCKFVSDVVMNTGGADSKPTIEVIKPQAIVIGSDWAKKDYYKQMQFTQDWLDERNITLIYVPYTEGVSTTEVKARVSPRPTFTAVVVAHGDVEQTEKCIKMLKEQTYKDTEILVFYSDMKPDPQYPDVNYLIQPNRNDWGQEKASHGLNAARGDYVGFFNIDDEYESSYIEKMIKKAKSENLDLVYCDFTSKEGSTIFGQPKLNIGTRGMFIVRTEFGRSVGYNHRDYGADGKFLEELVAAGAKHARLEDVLYRHK